MLTILGTLLITFSLVTVYGHTVDTLTPIYRRLLLYTKDSSGQHQDQAVQAASSNAACCGLVVDFGHTFVLNSVTVSNHGGE